MPGSGPVFEFFGFRLDCGRFETSAERTAASSRLAISSHFQSRCHGSLLSSAARRRLAHGVVAHGGELGLKRGGVSSNCGDGL
jgi:hypothetical protein